MFKNFSKKLLSKMDKSFHRFCQNKYMKFLDRSEIDMDFTYHEEGYDLTGLTLPGRDGVIIKYERKEDDAYNVGYEGYIRSEKDCKYAFIICTQFDDGESSMYGVVLDKDKYKQIDGSQNRELGNECFKYLEDKFNEIALERENKGQNLDF